MASGSGSGVGSSSSNAGAGASSGGAINAVQVLTAARVIPPNDDKKPLWRYVQKIANTGKGKGGNYSRVKAHLLKWSNQGVSVCPKVTVDVLIQLKGEQDRADALIASRLPPDVPLPIEPHEESAFYLHLIYEMWDTMIEKVKTAIYRREGKEPHEESAFYLIVHEVLVSRWVKSNTPLHCLAHSLNPKYYTEAWINEVPGRQAPHMDEEISEQRNKCFRRFFPGGDAELQKIKQQFANFSLFATGFYGFDSIEDRAYLDPKTWWGIHGNSAPDLRKLALKLLGQPTSSSCAERNWSTYGLIHNSMGNRLNPARAEDLVFIHQNLRLISRKSPEYKTGLSRFWDVGGDSHELFVGGADFLQQAELSLDEPELESLLDDIGALDIEETETVE